MWFMTSYLLLLQWILFQSKCLGETFLSQSFWEDAAIMDYITEDIYFEVLYPEKLRYTYRLRKARDFGAPFIRQLKGVRLVLADPLECCSLPHNALELEGAVALVARGDCSFVSKAVKAEEAGALAIIVMDNNIENDELYIEMVDDNTDREPRIPAAFLLGKSGFIIAKTLIEAQQESAIINIPVNLTSVPIHKHNQPPWVIW
ncbi:PA domain [Halocaridina rubra]|uniref:PA domain n=1 Tax=Halocaridina rubra TaxID=373956 RepID=A0AAN9A4T3_HALRR